MIKLHNFGMHGCTTSVRHYKAVETAHHARVAFDLPRHVDCCHMAIDSGSLILSWVNNSCAEGITDFGVVLVSVSSRRTRSARSNGTRKLVSPTNHGTAHTDTIRSSPTQANVCGRIQTPSRLIGPVSLSLLLWSHSSGNLICVASSCRSIR